MLLLSKSKSTSQKGMSLVSLMVGLLLAMIGILAGMMLYKNIVHTTLQTRSDALQDGQIASAMLTFQLELQSAGYGIPKDPAKTHILRPDGNSLYWRFDPSAEGTALQCRGFRVQDDADGNKRELVLLTLTSGCNDTAVLSSFDWNDDDDVKRNPLAEFRKSDALGVGLPEVVISQITLQSCFPYGMGAKEDHPMVTITVENAAITAAKKADSSASGPNAPFRYDFCLSNL